MPLVCKVERNSGSGSQQKDKKQQNQVKENKEILIQMLIQIQGSVASQFFFFFLSLK